MHQYIGYIQSVYQSHLAYYESARQQRNIKRCKALLAESETR